MKTGSKSERLESEGKETRGVGVGGRKRGQRGIYKDNSLLTDFLVPDLATH